MKHLTILLTLLLASLLAFNQEYRFVNEDCIVNNNVKDIVLIHVNKTFSGEEATVEMDETIGQIEPFPEILSKQFDSNIKKSQELYNKGDYLGAAKELEFAYKTEPKNLFISFNYARALYWVDSEFEKSFDIYKKIVDQLDKENGNSDTVLTVDMWFREAYWKLATLYMDKKDWVEAFHLINRFLLSIRDFKGQPVYTQSLEYLTECSYYMKEFELAEHFANRTLHFDPNNQFAQNVLKEIKK